MLGICALASVHEYLSAHLRPGAARGNEGEVHMIRHNGCICFVMSADGGPGGICDEKRNGHRLRRHTTAALHFAFSKNTC